MARGQPGFGQDRHGGQRQRGLGDIIAGVRLKFRPEGCDFFFRGGGTHQHAVAARAVHLFDHQIGEVIQHVFQRLGVRAAVRRHVVQDRLFARVEFDDIRHVAVDRLVIRNARPGGVCNGDAARAVDIHDARHAQHAVGIEGQRIEEIVVDPAVEHVNGLVAPRRAHRHAPVHHPQVVPFDKLGAHLIGEEGVFVIGGVVDAGRQHCKRWSAAAGIGSAGHERAAQALRVLADRLHFDLAEQLGEHVQHRLAIFEHIADAGRGAGVVLQHIEFIVVGAHQVGAHDMGVDVAGWCDPDHFRQKGIVARQHFGGQAPCAHDFLSVIDVMQKCVERTDPLFDALGHFGPFASRNDARHQIERDQPFGGVRVAIDIEGDPD
mmetsp:Transcript_23677/g.42197  ORF Transcript_23677/g.42197 Transcript_23677/m.42197 type:complete len:377 (+) Transcript_23677:1070-2200(+)